MNAFNHDDPVQTFHKRDGESEPFIKQQIDRSILSEQQQHGDRPNERGHD